MFGSALVQGCVSLHPQLVGNYLVARIIRMEPVSGDQACRDWVYCSGRAIEREVHCGDWNAVCLRICLNVTVNLVKIRLNRGENA